MADFFIALLKISIIEFGLFFIFNKFLLNCILNENPKKWTMAYTIAALIIPILCNILSQSHTFAFIVSVFFIIQLSGYSANHKESEEIYQEIEILQKKTRIFAIVASIVGYMSYAQII